MKFYIKHLDRWDGRECYSTVDARNENEARNKYLIDYPNANICNIYKMPEGCITVGELRKLLDGFPYCTPVYIGVNPSLWVERSILNYEQEVN